MNLRHIEVFHAVYTHGSVSAAARALNVSQPSVSKMLRHAEQMLGFALFERTGGKLIATEDAHTLFTEVADIQERVTALRRSGRNLRRGRGAVLRISALPSIALRVLPQAVVRFMRTHEGVLFDLQTVHHEDMVRKLYERETDVVIGYEVPPTAPVAHRWLGEAELVVIYRSDQMPDAPPRIPLRSLEGAELISPMHSGPVGRLLAAELNRLDMCLNEIVSARTFYIAAALVRAGLGMTIADDFTANAAQDGQLTYRPIQPPLAFDVHAIHLQNRPPSKLTNAFLTVLSEEIDKV